MKSLRQYLLISACLLVISSGLSRGQSVDLSGLQSDDWRTRAATLRKIVAHPEILNQQSTKDELVKCLAHEDEILTGSRIVQPSPFDDETYSDNYLSMLGQAVYNIAQQDNDERAYDALIPSDYNWDSPVGIAILSRPANFGRILALASNRGLGQRMNAAAGLSYLLLHAKQAKDNSISDEQYREAKAALRKLVGEDPEVPVRQIAVRSLSSVGDKEDVTLLQKAAAQDPAKYRGEDGLDHYPP